MQSKLEKQKKALILERVWLEECSKQDSTKAKIKAQIHKETIENLERKIGY